MEKFKLLSYIPLILELLLIIILSYNKLKKNYNISFNSFYLLIFCLLSLILCHIISFQIFSLFTNKIDILIIIIIFFISYTIRIKRLLDCISLSKILKSTKIKNKSKILFEKSFYSFETIYFLIFAFLSTLIISLFYYLKEEFIENYKKYILFMISIILFAFFIYKFFISDIKKKIKKNFTFEIILFLILFLNLSYTKLNEDKNESFFQYIIIFIFEILFILSIGVNCIRFSRIKISEEKFLINKKLKSDFFIFFNNELCFYVFNKYYNKNYSDSKILMKLYLDINKYKMKNVLNENFNDLKNIYVFFDNNKQFIKNQKLKEKLEKNFESVMKKVDEKEFENISLDEIFTIINNDMNNIFNIFKKSKEHKKLFSILDLLYFLDEYIYVEAFYFEFNNNEELKFI